MSGKKPFQHRNVLWGIGAGVVIVFLLFAVLVHREYRSLHWPWTSAQPERIARVKPHHQPGPRTSFPWKKGVLTTVFWIGEGPIGHGTTNQISSAWDQNWQESNGGTDTPNDRDGYAPNDHASRVNPFYVALPFNDLAWPDDACDWVPTNWHRNSRHGVEISWCKDRWVQIRNAQGRSCFAQWEDVGPGRTRAAEYVFGDAEAGSSPGLDVSPAVAQYLGFSGSATTSWRFVDDSNVPPGEWLKYDEMALIYKAIHQQQPATPPPHATGTDNDISVKAPADDASKSKPSDP